ncbi:extensin-like [Punica granatum]|uniref:Extensin-like n=1 Tax=Punica granatum TaxID=22663 RepID=A0A6P8EB68_PUNGR|nr:extensin-like [Punica granatum]
MAEDQQLAIHEHDTPPTPHSQTPLTQVISPPMPADISTAHSGIPIGHPPPTAQTASNLVESARFTALEGMVNHLAANMATNMTELMAMLRNQNQASSSFTSPLEHRPIVDPNPTITPTFVSEVEDASFSTMTFIPTVHPINDPLPPPPAPTAVPLPPAAFLSTDSTMHTLPSLTVSMHPPIYTVPPPTIPPVTIAQAPVSTADQFPFQTPQPK